MIKELYEAPRRRRRAGKSWKLLYKINKLFAVTFFPLKARGQKGNGIDPQGEIIVSLTTFPARIDSVWITIASILNQTVKPKMVLLWLSKTQFPGGEAALPQKLLKLKDRGLSIRFCDEDIRSHKKYYYTMKEYPEDIVVTIDDDMLYPENCLEQLLAAHKKHPTEICCQYAHVITYQDGKLLPYRNWVSCYGDSTEPNMQILPVGCGGVLYTPGLLDARVLDKEIFWDICPQMDDLWLKTMEVLKGTKACICEEGSLIYFDMTGTRKSGLQHVNVGENQNDVAIEKIFKMFPEVEERLRN